MFFITDQNDPRISKIIKQEKALRQEQLAHLHQREQLLFKSKEDIQNNYGHYLILTRAISGNEGQLGWLNPL